MNASVRLTDAAHRVLSGDTSVGAARELETVLLDEYAGDERVEELIYALSMYAPGAGSPYFDAADLREAVKRALVAVDGSSGEA